MRVLVDTNVLISSIFSSDSPPGQTIQAGLASVFELLVSEISIAELTQKCRNKPSLAKRISESQLSTAIRILEEGVTILPALPFSPEEITRDPKDDYLIAHAIDEKVDILVSGDRDLLTLADAQPFRILAPAEFIALLDSIEP